MSNPSVDMYTGENSQYIQNIPTWHVEHSPWKAGNILKLLQKNDIHPKTVAEVGCGAGEILNQLYAQLPDDVVFSGYDISSDAIKLAKTREKDRLTYYNENLLETDESVHFNLLLMIDVFEHIEDYYGFLRQCKKKADYMILGIPLDISLRTFIRPYNLRVLRDEVGHVHSFNSHSALLTIENAGLTMVDHFFVSLNYDTKRFGFFRRSVFRSLYTLFGKQRTADIFGYHTLYALVK